MINVERIPARDVEESGWRVVDTKFERTIAGLACAITYQRRDGLTVRGYGRSLPQAVLAVERRIREYGGLVPFNT